MAKQSREWHQQDNKIEYPYFLWDAYLTFFLTHVVKQLSSNSSGCCIYVVISNPMTKSLFQGSILANKMVILFLEDKFKGLGYKKSLAELAERVLICSYWCLLWLQCYSDESAPRHLLSHVSLILVAREPFHRV